MQTPKFSNVPTSFYVELKKRTAQYFDATGKDTTGGFKIFIKALLLVLAANYICIQLIFFTPSTIPAILLSVALGCVTAAIGFNVMHDGAHGSFSKYPFINKCAAVTTEFLGASHFMWNMKHNVIHHAYTNIDGIDDDIDAKPFMRMASTQKKYKIHRYQHWYFVVLYSLLLLFWIFYSDFRKYFTGKIGEMPIKKMKLKDHITFWTYKMVHYGLFIVVPIYMVGFKDWLIGYAIFTLVTGFILSIVFQLAHTVEDTHFPMPDVVTGKLEDEWAIHQLKTTANFATRNKIVSWYTGGLNFQIEHHLFPKISHVHYPAISKIIKQACQEYKVAYIEYPKMRTAVASHVSFLKQMGR